MPKIAYAFKCPSPRKKGAITGICDGLMVAQTENHHADLITYCPKCSQFYSATYHDGIYHFSRIDKSEILFITQVALFENEVHAHA